MTREEALRRVVFLKGAGQELITALVAASHTRLLKPGEALFLEAQTSTGLTVILEGSVKEGKTDSRGRELVIAMHLPGSVLGELPLADGGNHPTQAMGGAEGALVLVIPRESFLSIGHSYPLLMQGMLRALAIHQRKLLEMLKAQALHTVRARLATYLLAQPGETNFKLYESHESIAAQVGTVREVISRTLNQLADQGLIAIQGRTVTVQDREALERLAQGG